MKTLLEKNGYALMQLEDKNGVPQYTYGSVEYLNKENVEQMIGNAKEMLKSCKHSLKQCNKTLDRYKLKDPLKKGLIEIAGKLYEQKEALVAFIEKLEALK